MQRLLADDMLLKEAEMYGRMLRHRNCVGCCPVESPFPELPGGLIAGGRSCNYSNPNMTGGVFSALGFVGRGFSA